MGSFVSLGLIIFLLLSTGCTSIPAKPSKNRQKQLKIKTASKEISDFKEYQKAHNKNIPKMILPPAYQEISVFDGQTITFSAENANLYKVLYSISKLAGLNLIIDRNVEKNIPITLSVKDANLEDVLKKQNNYEN